MPKAFLAWTTGCLFVLAVLPTEAAAAGSLVDCVSPALTQDMIPGITFDAVRYSEYRCHFRGATPLPHDATHRPYQYDVPVWIITPERLADGNGTVVVEPLHTAGMEAPFPTHAEGEMALALYMLGPRFLFRSGAPGFSAPNFTWVGVRWDPDAINTSVPSARYDHLYEQRYHLSPGSISAPPNRALYVGIAMVADLADAVRGGRLTLRGQSAQRRFADVERVLSHGVSQSSGVLRYLLQDMPNPRNGGGVHHAPLFDGWMMQGGGGLFYRWPRIAADGTLRELPPIFRARPPASDLGKIIDLNTEQDIGPTLDGFAEYVRFANAPAQRSYEVAGASHFNFGQVVVDGGPGGAIFRPALADTLAEQAAIRSVTPGYHLPVVDALTCMSHHPLACANPLDWQPLDRSLFAALNAWVARGVRPPPNAWLLPARGRPRYGDASKRFDAVGNALGGIRLPAVAIGRGRFFATSPDVPFPGDIILAGAYVDRHERFGDHFDYVSRYARATIPLVQHRYLLPADGLLMLREALGARVGIPPF